MLDLTTPIEKLNHVGPKSLLRLKQLGINTVKDLLHHFPTRYDDYSNIVPISEIKESGMTVGIQGEVTDIKINQLWRRRMSITSAVISDETDEVRAVWFNQPYLENSLPIGTIVSLAGKVNTDKKGLFLSNPQYEKVFKKNELTHTGRLVPVYPVTKGITSKYLRFLLKPVLAQAKSLPDPLPSPLLSKYDFPGINKALQHIHFPENVKEAEGAGKRFAFEDILLFQLRVLRDHRQLQTLKSSQIKFDKDLISDFVKNLPFELTNDQRVSAYEILQDLERSYPMNRLLNGDVGSGKTIVAFVAAYQAVSLGLQVAFMAPTEILAKQHFETAVKIFNNKKTTVRIGLLTGSEARQWPIDELEEAPMTLSIGVPTDNVGKKISKKLMNQKIANGEIDLLIGTHAVIQKGVQFKNLALVVIDEQHRFGVEQRMKLVKNQNLVPHLLSMTATPIPRTLALTIYGDLDVSLLKEKPKGRQEIITKIISDTQREEAHKFIEREIKKGRQVFVVCPRIDSSAAAKDGQKISQAKLLWAEIKAVTDEYKKLSEKVFPKYKIAMLHGKMKFADKSKIIGDFKNGDYDVLVSTSVIEVGVDIPNATIMMIESAERFGLAQLHQFRGRVGRGSQQSHCLLFTSSDNAPIGRRLRTLEKTNDGFELAEMDLKIRGPGEFTGIKQSGLPDIAMASLGDIELIKKARLEAKLLLKEDPTLKKYPALLIRLAEIQRLVHFE